MGSIADHLGEPAVYVFKDVEHRVSPFTMAVQGAFERYIEAYAVQSYQRNSHLLSPDDAEKALSGIMRDIAGGKYSFGSDAVSKALDSPLHLKKLMWLCMKKCDSSVTEALVEEIAREDYRGMIDALNRANPQGNRKTPAEADDAGVKTTTSSADAARPMSSASA